MKEIYIIRHGETDLNKAGIIQGQGIDAPLNKRGWEQAESFYEQYKGHNFDIVLTSALKRTHQTVSGFLDDHIYWKVFPDLNEINWGLFEGNHPDIFKGAYEEIYSNWRNGNLNSCAPEGESPLQITSRMNRVIDYLRSVNGEKVLICMHGRAMRIFLCAALKKNLCDMDQFPHQNLSLYKLNLENETFFLQDFNKTDHLNRIA